MAIEYLSPSITEALQPILSLAGETFGGRVYWHPALGKMYDAYRLPEVFKLLCNGVSFNVACICSSP